MCLGGGAGFDATLRPGCSDGCRGSRAISGFSLRHDAYLTSADNARLSPASRDDRGVRGHAAARREHTVCGCHARNVVGARLGAHEQHWHPLRRKLLRFST